MSETREQAATRRRWINLAELVAVAGVVIAALSLWLSWSERRDDAAERRDAVQQAAKKDRFIAHGATEPKGEAVTLTGDDDHTIGEVRFTFPAKLGVPAQDAVAGELDRRSFAKPLLKLTDGGPDDAVGRLPVLVAYDYTDADGQHRASGIYDIVWKTEGGFPLGRSLKATAFRLRRPGGTAADLDRLWVVPKH